MLFSVALMQYCLHIKILNKTLDAHGVVSGELDKKPHEKHEISISWCGRTPFHDSHY